MVANGKVNGKALCMRHVSTRSLQGEQLLPCAGRRTRRLSRMLKSSAAGARRLLAATRSLSLRARAEAVAAAGLAVV